MTYRKASLRDTLASEYALGMLRGGARRRFERLLARDPHMRAAVAGWERRMIRLAAGLEPIVPPVCVWQGIQRRVGMRTEQCRFERRLDFWRPSALAASALAALLLIYVGLTELAPFPFMGTGLAAPPAALSYVGLLADRGMQPAWLVRVSRARDRLAVTAVRPQTIGEQRAFELWLIARPGHAPQSLGLIPSTGEFVLKLPKPLDPENVRAAMLAVSLEPAGGSHTGQPTGPVLYQGALLLLDG